MMASWRKRYTLGVAAAALSSVCVSPIHSAHATNVPTTGDSWQNSSGASQVFTVKNTHLSAMVVRTEWAVERCELQLSATACADLRQSANAAEIALLKRGRAVLDSNEPKAVGSDAPYADIAVTVVEGGNFQAVMTPISPSDSPLSNSTAPSAIGTSKLKAVTMHTQPLRHAKDPVTLNNNYQGCDSTWCYSHYHAIYYSDFNLDTLQFEFDFKYPASASQSTVWGSNWRVYGTATAPDNWNNSWWYSNSANSDHSIEWPIASGIDTAGVGPVSQSVTVQISCTLTKTNVTCSGSHS